MWMPQGADAHFVVSLDPVVQLGGLPVPNIQLSICIPRHHIAHVWREVHLAGIASHHVALENFLLVQSEAVLGSKDKNLVVHGLACQPLTIGRECHSWHGVHTGLSNVLEVHRDVPLPNSKALVI